MARSMLAASSSLVFDANGHGDAFQYLGFHQGTGEILSHGPRAIYALARADLREPNAPIEILDAGVAGKRLWQNQTSLPVARRVLDQLAEPWSGDAPGKRLHVM